MPYLLFVACKMKYYKLSYDKFFPKADRIYRITNEGLTGDARHRAVLLCTGLRSKLISYDTIKAIQNYEKFLDLWKDAYPGLADVNDAKNKLEK